MVAGQRGERAQFCVSDHLVCDEDVWDIGRPRHHDRLPDGRAGNSDGAGRDLQPRQLRRLVRLDVRAEPRAELAHDGCHPGDVAPGEIQVEQQGGGLDLTSHPSDLVAVAVEPELMRELGQGAASIATGRRIPRLASGALTRYARDQPVGIHKPGDGE